MARDALGVMLLTVVVMAGCGGSSSESSPVSTLPESSSPSASAVASPAGASSAPPDSGAELACKDIGRLVTTDPAKLTDKDVAAIESAATQSSTLAVAEAGRALGQARLVWTRDKALFTSDDDLAVVEAGLFAALLKFADACAAAG